MAGSFGDTGVSDAVAVTWESARTDPANSNVVGAQALLLARAATANGWAHFLIAGNAFADPAAPLADQSMESA